MRALCSVCIVMCKVWSKKEFVCERERRWQAVLEMLRGSESESEREREREKEREKEREREKESESER